MRSKVIIYEANPKGNDQLRKLRLAHAGHIGAASIRLVSRNAIREINRNVRGGCGAGRRRPGLPEIPSLAVHRAGSLQLGQLQRHRQLPSGGAVDRGAGAECVRVRPGFDPCGGHERDAGVRGDGRGRRRRGAHAVLHGRRRRADRRRDACAILVDRRRGAHARLDCQQRAGAGRVVAAQLRLLRRDGAGADEQNGQLVSLHRCDLWVAAGEDEFGRTLRGRRRQRDRRIAFGGVDRREGTKGDAATAAACRENACRDQDRQLKKVFCFHRRTMLVRYFHYRDQAVCGVRMHVRVERLS